MADLNKTVQIIFGATDKTGNTITGVSSRIDKVSAPVAKLTKNFLLLEVAVLAVGVALGVKAFSEAASFEGALLDLQKVMSDTDGEASQFTGTVDQMSNRFGVAATDILQGAANFKQAGFTVKESFDLQKIALETATVSNLDAVEASELLVSSLKGFKAPASEAGRLTDILNEVSNQYATSLKELGIGMAEISPIANLMGFSFEETAGILTPVIEVFRSGNEAAVALKTGLLRLISDTAPVEAALESIGVSQKDANGALRSGRDILLDVGKAFTTVDESQKLFLASELVGIRQAGRLVEVFNGLAKSTEVTAVSMDAAGSRLKEVNIRLAASEVQVDRAKVAFNNMARSIGEQFRPELTGVIGAVTDLEISLQGIAAGGGFEPLMRIIRPQLREWQEIIGNIAGALPAAFAQTDFTPILSALGRLDDSFDGLFDGLDLSKPEDLARVFSTIIDISGSLIDVTRGIVEIFGTVGGILFDVVKWFSTLDSGIQKLIGSVGGISIALTTLLIPALAATGLAMSAFAGIGGIGKLISVLTGAGGLASALGAASTKVGSLNAALGVSQFQKVSFTKSLGKAGLAGAVGIASFELGKLIEKSTGLSDKLFPDKDTFFPAPTDAEFKAFEDAVNLRRAESGGLALPGENFPFEKAALDAIKDRTTAEEELLTAIQKRLDAEQVGFNTLPGENTEAEKKALALTREKTEAEDKLLNVLLKKEDLALPGENTKEEEKSLAIVKEKARVEGAGDEKRKRSVVDVTRILDTSISSTGDTLSNLANTFTAVGGLGGNVGQGISKAFKNELTNRNKLLERQERLADSQIRLNEAKAEQIETGEATINITADGLEPELEAFMWQIVDKVQIRANADGAEYLLGINT